MSSLIAFLAGAVCGVISGFGIGGGTILLLYLTFVAGFSQRVAQGLNLLYFLPTAAAAIVVHHKNRLVDWRSAVPAMIAGCISAGATAWLSTHLQGDWLRRLFGGFLIIIAIYELRWKPKDIQNSPE